MRSVEEFAKHALALDQREPNALLAKTLLQSRLDDWVTTENKFRQILDIAPDHIPAMANLVFLLQGVGRSHESWNLGNRAIAVDPMIPTLQFRHAFKLWIFGRIGEADRVVDRARELWPWHPWVWIARLLIFSFTGRPSAALAMVEDGADRPASWPKPGIDLWRASLAALESRQSSDVAEAREAIFRAAPLGAGFAIHGAMLLSAMGEIDAAYAVVDGILLRRGKLVPGSPTTDRSWLSTQWVFTPATAPLRADPRFAGLCDGIGLLAYWRRRGVWPDPFLRGSLEIKA